jgi:UDP-N-acetyl-2-amino-2-deoxyglucuronate dehydrogenase
MPEPTKVRFGIVGCGGAAVPVAEALAASPVAALAWVHDLDAALACDLGQRYGVPHAARLEPLLDDTGVDAVYVAVPHRQLAPVAHRVLEAGKHALVEKPLATTLSDADALIALAEARGLALGVFYELRHTTAYQQARTLIREGAIGKIIGVRIQTLIDKMGDYWQRGLSGRSANPWRGLKDEAGGGVVLMNSSHALDAVLYLTGLKVMHVTAEIGTLVAGVEVEDTAAATLRFDNGAIGSLFAGAHLAGSSTGDERFDLYGTQGQIRMPDAYGADPLRVFLRRDWGGLAAGHWHTLPCIRVPVYARAAEAFARAVQRGEPAPTSGREARMVLAVVLGLYQAAAERQTLAIGQDQMTHV